MSEAPISPDDWPTFSGKNRDTGTSFSAKILSTGVILVALVVSIVGFLHLYIPFALRRRLLDRRRSTVDLALIRANINAGHGGGEPSPSSGLEPSAIAALPAFLYRKADHGGGGDRLQAAECSICLSLVAEGETARLLPSCRHLFHAGCIDMWLGSHSTCPVCRAPVEPRPSSATSDMMGDGSGRRAIEVVAELREDTGSSEQEGSTSTSSKESSASVSTTTARFSLSIRRMLSGRERASETRSVHENVGPDEDLERTRSELPLNYVVMLD